MKTPNVGDVLFLAFDDDRRAELNHDVRAVAVGTRWVQVLRDGAPGFARRRFRRDDPDRLIDAGRYSADARVFESRDAWEKQRLLTRLWRELARRMSYGIPRGCPAQFGDVLAAGALLGIVLPDL